MKTKLIYITRTTLLILTLCASLTGYNQINYAIKPGIYEEMLDLSFDNVPD